MQDMLLVLHSSSAAALAEQLCEHLSTFYFTLPTTELHPSSTAIDTSDLKNFKNNVDITNKTLCLITAMDTEEYVNAVNTLLKFKQLHEKIFLLCCDTSAQHIIMPDGAYYRQFTKGEAVYHDSVKLLNKASGTCSHSRLLWYTKCIWNFYLLIILIVNKKYWY